MTRSTAPFSPGGAQFVTESRRRNLLSDDAGGQEERTAVAWRSMPEQKAQERARAAASAKDEEELAGLLQAHLELRGRSGGRGSPLTAKAYRRGLVLLLRHARGEALGAKPQGPARARPARTLEDARPVDLLDPPRDWGFGFARTLEAAGLAPATVQSKLAMARAMFAALRWAKATEVDPFRDVHAASDHTPAWEQRPAYSEGEVEALMSAASTPRDRVSLLLLAHGGLRATEAAELRWDAIDLQAGVAIVVGKGRRRRSVCLSNSLRRELKMLAVEDPKPWRRVLDLQRSGLASLLSKIAKKATVRWRGPHALRHYAGTRLYAETKDLGFVAAHLGHARLETARRYAGQPAGLGDVVGRW